MLIKGVNDFASLTKFHDTIIIEIKKNGELEKCAVVMEKMVILI